MKVTKGINPVLRAVGVVGAVVALAGGVTYAAFGNAVALTGTSLSTTAVNLKIWNGTTFADTAPGFNLENLSVNNYSPKQLLRLNNISDQPIPVVLKLGNNTSTRMPVYDGMNYHNIKVKVTAEWYDADSCTDENNSIVAPLLDMYYNTKFDLPCGPLPAGADGNPQGDSTKSFVGQYSIQFLVTGLNEGATSGNIHDLDLEFAARIDE
jgi:hypothetical protein